MQGGLELVGEVSFAWLSQDPEARSEELGLHASVRIAGVGQVEPVGDLGILLFVGEAGLGAGAGLIGGMESPPWRIFLAGFQTVDGPRTGR